jgi:hypothetical protein
MQILFIDESGDHSLSVIDPQYPLFVLGGVIIEKTYAAYELTEQMNTFKQKVFGTTDIILHTAEISRNKNKFKCLKDPNFRAFFYQELNCMMRQLQYTIVACVIHKDNHLSRYGPAALDPYHLSLNVLLERFCYDIYPPNMGLIIAEKRDEGLDRQLKATWLNLQSVGTRYLKARKLSKSVQDFSLHPKTDNIAGLQLADLVVSPIGRHILGKPQKEDFQIIRKKFRKNKVGVYEGYGLVVLPKTI